MKKTTKKYLSIALVLLLTLAACGRRVQYAEITGYVTYIDGLYAAGDRVWVKRLKSSVPPREYDLYCLGDTGEEEYVCPFPGAASAWDAENGKFYCVSEGNKSITEFDPAAGEIAEYPLTEAPQNICGAEAGCVFFQTEAKGPVTMLSTADLQERTLAAEGWITGIYGGCIFSWDSQEHVLTCYSCAEDKKVWQLDLFDLYERATIQPVLCESGGELYLANTHGGYIYAIPRFYEECVPVMTEGYGSVIGMADAGGCVVYAQRLTSSVKFVALGRDEELATWEEAYYDPSSGPLSMALCGGKMYCALKTKDMVFSFDFVEKQAANSAFSVIVPPNSRKVNGKREITVTISQRRETQSDEMILLGSFEAATDEAFTEPVELILNEELSGYTDETQLRYRYRYTALVPISATELWIRTPECEIERPGGPGERVSAGVFREVVWGDHYQVMA